MRHRCIDADHQVQRLDQRGGVGEVMQFLGPVVQPHALGRLRAWAAASPFCRDTKSRSTTSAAPASNNERG